MIVKSVKAPMWMFGSSACSLFVQHENIELQRKQTRETPRADVQTL
jgi:hypothetical protein